jgi:hypothetical protein
LEKTKMKHNIIYLKEKKYNYIVKLEKALSKLYVNSFLNIYEFVKSENKQKKFLLRDFQHAIKNISSWDTNMIIKEHDEFAKAYSSNNEKLDHIINSIFKLNYNIFCELENISETNYVLPESYNYIYQCYLNIARKLWKEPFLLYDINIDKIQYQKNLNRIDKICKKCINETFYHMVSYDEINSLSSIIKEESISPKSESDVKVVDNFVVNAAVDAEDAEEAVDTEDAEAVVDTEDAEEVEAVVEKEAVVDAEETEDAEEAEDAEDAKDIKDAKAVVDTEDADDADDANDTEDAEDTEDADDAEDAEDTEDADDAEDAEEAEDAEDAEDSDDAEADIESEVDETIKVITLDNPNIKIININTDKTEFF